MQLMARDLGAELVKLEHAEYGPATLHVDDRSTPLFEDVAGDLRVWMSHGDSVVKLPAGFVRLGSTQRCDVAAMGDPARKMYGLQFHPEVVHTEHGATILCNFLRSVAGLADEWRMDSFVERALAAIRQQVGSDGVICALSGGVDSAVAATLVSRAIGSQLTCIFVDHGLLRKRRSRTGGGGISRRAASQRRCRRRTRTVFAQSSTASSIRRRSASSSGTSSSACSKNKPRDFPTSPFSFRGRSIPTSSSPRRPRARPAIRSSRITTSGGLPETDESSAGRAAAASVQG